MVLLHICQSPMQFALLHLHTMTNVWFCICHWSNLYGPFSHWDWEFDVCFFPRTSWNVDSSNSTHFRCLFDYLRWALAQRTWRQYSFLLVTAIQVAFLNAVADCGKLQQISEVLLSTAIWGIKGHAHSPEVSYLTQYVLIFLWIPWIVSQYYIW